MIARKMAKGWQKKYLQSLRGYKLINLKSQRLQIRNFLTSDAEDLLEIYSSPELRKYIDDERLESIDDAKRLLKRYQGPHLFDSKLGVFAVVERSLNKVIGTALLVPLRDHEGNFLADIEVGYHINKMFWNKGYATEVSRCLTQYAFDEVGLSELFAVVLPNNNSSIRVLEKSGMKFQGNTSEYYGENLHRFKITSSSLQVRIDLFEKFGIGLKRDNIVVLKDHNPKWKSLFNSEKKVIEQNLGIDSLNLHHCGSTAISHICAKPIIDILGEIEDTL